MNFILFGGRRCVRKKKNMFSINMQRKGKKKEGIREEEEEEKEEEKKPTTQTVGISGSPFTLQVP